MYKLLKKSMNFVLLCTVVFLGYCLFQTVKTPGKDPELSVIRKDISENWKEIKKKAKNTKVSAEKVIGQAQETLIENREKTTQYLKTIKRPKKKNHPKDRLESSIPKLPSSGALDSEDLKLTAKVLEHKGAIKDPIADSLEEQDGFDKAIAPMAPAQVLKPKEPLDLKRMAKIRELYLDTIDVLTLRQ